MGQKNQENFPAYLFSVHIMYAFLWYKVIGVSFVNRTSLTRRKKFATKISIKPIQYEQWNRNLLFIYFSWFQELINQTVSFKEFQTYSVAIITQTPLHKKWSFSLRISSVYVTKSAANGNEVILNGKLHFLCSAYNESFS